MIFKQDKFRQILPIAIILVFVIGVFYYLFEDSKAEAFNTEQIKIFPSSYKGDWEIPQDAFIQDLNEAAGFDEFNIENSAYLILEPSKIPKKSSSGSSSAPPSQPAEPIVPTEPVELIEPSIPSGSTTSTPEASKPVFLADFWKRFVNLFKINIAKAQEAPVIISNKVLEFSGFGITNEFQDKKIVNVQLRLSLAGKSTSAEDKLSIEYSQGDSWNALPDILFNAEVSNAVNNGYWLYALPIFQSWEDFENLKIKFSIDPCGESETLCDFELYLDSLWLEVNYEENLPTASLGSSASGSAPQVSKAVPPKSVSGKKSFKNNEDPIFELPQTPNLKVKKTHLIDNQGEETGIEIILQENTVIVKKPRIFKPGTYILQIEVEEDGEVYIIEEEFLWGVLAINTNKSIYLPNEQAYLQMGVVNDMGNTVCHANLQLEITSPNGQIDYPVVEESGECRGDSYVEVPDYFTYYQISEIGTYQMRLINLDNQYEIVDSFEVWESVLFDVERIGPSRIYPPAIYQVRFNIIANQDFVGQVIESMPVGFQAFANDSIETIIEGDTKKVIWEVDWQNGQSYEITYSFDAPNISPYLYLLGPLEIHN